MFSILQSSSQCLYLKRSMFSESDDHFLIVFWLVLANTAKPLFRSKHTNSNYNILLSQSYTEDPELHYNFKILESSR